MKYIIINLKSFYIHKKILFYFLGIMVVLSCMILEFSYGIFENYRIKQLSKIESHTEFVIDVLNKTDSDYFDKKMLQQCISEFPEELEDKLNGVIIEADGEGGELVYCYFSLKKGKITTYEEVCKNFMQNNLATEYFSQSQEENGERVALFPVTQEGNLIQDIFKIENEETYFQGKKYKVIGYQNFDDKPIVPFASLENDTKIDPEADINLSFVEALSVREYETLKECFYRVAKGYVELPEVDLSEDDNSLYNTMMIISAFISVISAGNFSILFQYLLEEYQKSYRIFRICGMSKLKMRWNFMIMGIVIAVPTFLIGTLIYHFGIYRTFLVKIFPYIKNVYSMDKYIILFGVYLFFMILILWVRIVEFVKKQQLTVR